MKALMWLSALANLALGSALIWMRETSKETAKKMLEVTLHAEEVHMKICALALDALENPDPESAREAQRALSSILENWERNKDSGDELLEAFE